MAGSWCDSEREQRRGPVSTVAGGLPHDHVAGATAGVELAKRMARVHQHSEHGPGLGSLANDV